MSHQNCKGCQICFEYALEEQYGPEWWNDPGFYDYLDAVLLDSFTDDEEFDGAHEQS